MPSQPLHEDFGEKIGGAKKDLWSARGLYSADLDDMNEREADKYVRKDNVWKKPDYQAMLDDGIPIGVVYYIKKVRDAVPASPRYYRAYNYEENHISKNGTLIPSVSFKRLWKRFAPLRTLKMPLLISISETRICGLFGNGTGGLPMSGQAIILTIRL